LAAGGKPLDHVREAAHNAKALVDRRKEGDHAQSQHGAGEKPGRTGEEKILHRTDRPAEHGIGWSIV